MAKKRIATTSLAGCFGCHMSILDIDERILELAEIVDFDRSPIDDIKHISQRCDVGLIEGGCCNAENVETLREFRENCDVVISLGDCATMGGIPALRNLVTADGLGQFCRYWIRRMIWMALIARMANIRWQATLSGPRR